jgi:hypothetical protein
MKLEKDLDIYDVWESPNGNIFIKISENYSIGIGRKGNHEPNNTGDLEQTQYTRCDVCTPVKKIGKLSFKKNSDGK